MSSTARNMPLVLVVSLWLRTEDIAAFEVFERDAARLIERHGGKVERVIRTAPAGAPDAPFETHIVTFPDAQSFERYREDPQSRALAPRREALIERTVVTAGTDQVPY